MSVVAGVLLAAGAGSRFGRDGPPKVLHPFRGRPLLTWPVAALRDSGAERVVVVLGARADEVAAGAALGDAEVVRCDDWAEGLSASLRAGVRAAAAGGADAVVIALADQPLLDARAAARLIAARTPSLLDALRATYAGAPGHPTLLESSTIPPRASALSPATASAVRTTWTPQRHWPVSKPSLKPACRRAAARGRWARR